MRFGRRLEFIVRTCECCKGSVESMSWATKEGSPVPLGATWVSEEQAYNFALYSKHAERVTLLLYASQDLVQPVFSYTFDRLNSAVIVGRMKKSLLMMLACVFVVMIRFGITLPVLPFYAERLALAEGTHGREVRHSRPQSRLNSGT